MIDFVLRLLIIPNYLLVIRLFQICYVGYVAMITGYC